MEAEPTHKIDKVKVTEWLNDRLPKLELAYVQAYTALNSYIEEYGADDEIKQRLAQTHRDATEASTQIVREFANKANWDHTSTNVFDAQLKTLAVCKDRVDDLTDEATSPSTDETDNDIQRIPSGDTTDVDADSTPHDDVVNVNDTTPHLSLRWKIKEYVVGVNGKPPLYQAHLAKRTKSLRDWWHSRTEAGNPESEHTKQRQAKREARAHRKAEREAAQQEENRRHSYGDGPTDPADN